MFMSSSRSLRTRAGVLALLLQSTQTSTQSGLLSCANVDCPILDNTAISNCSVAGASYSVIGLTSIQSLSGSNLEWTIAVNQSKTGNDSLINRAFYLGVESSNFFESQGQSACSFFFTTLDDGPLFYDPMTSVSTDCTSRDGTGFSSQCISDLKSKANDLPTSDTSICNSIAQTLQDDPPSSCSLASGTKVVAVPLTGSPAPEPISAAENETSNCWPTLPKTNQLLPVWTASIYTSIENDTTIRSGTGTTPVMTIFFAEGNNEKSSAELVCLRPVDLNEKSAETMDDGTSEAQGMHVVPRRLVVLGLIFLATCVLL
ncbi:hypothetical protein D6D17_01835 [Aureobasidium pullulans]|nr:hypothetical protein D6D29_03449 [Aureobasidium pullulans]THX18837.1 hypothetical protein D6D17_01835 [Aureobasidium pullulans]